MSSSRRSQLRGEQSALENALQVERAALAARLRSAYMIGRQDTGTSRAANESAILNLSGPVTATFGLNRSTNWSAVLAVFRQ